MATAVRRALITFQVPPIFPPLLECVFSMVMYTVLKQFDIQAGS